MAHLSTLSTLWLSTQVLGYEAIPALRGAWLRGVRDGDIPFERAYALATKLYESKDADLLPRKRKG
jgi:hypothetical protein